MLQNSLNKAVCTAIAYRTRVEEGTRPQSRTIPLRSGSCRDLTALFLCTARRLGLAARAASGYLFEPGSVAGDIGEPMHGEVFLPADGWVAFDLTQRGMDSAGLVTAAIGVTSEAVLPVGGGFPYDADDFVGMEERVVSRHSTFVR